MPTQKNNAKCTICGKDYFVCKSCKSHNLTPWKIHTDTAEHYQVFQILRGVFLGVYTKSEAKEKLQSLNLKDADTYLPSVQKQIQDIMNEPDVQTSDVEVVTEEPDNNAAITELNDDPKIEDRPVVKTKKGNRKKV